MPALKPATIGQKLLTDFGQNRPLTTDYKVDYIISHTGPYEVITELGYECHDAALQQVRFLQQVADQVDFQNWYFGHFHEDVDVENYHCRIDEVTQIE